MSSSAQERLAALADSTIAPVKAAVTAGTQVSHAKPHTLQVNDLSGDPVTSSVRLKVVFRKSDGLVATSSEITMAETGAGTVVSTTAKPTLILDTDATGLAEVTVTDVGTAGISGYLEVTPVNRAGAVALAAVSLT
jgi:hypothetical protein